MQSFRCPNPKCGKHILDIEEIPPGRTVLENLQYIKNGKKSDKCILMDVLRFTMNVNCSMSAFPVMDDRSSLGQGSHQRRDILRHPGVYEPALKSPYSEGRKLRPFRNRRWKGEVHIKDQCFKRTSGRRDKRRIFYNKSEVWIDSEKLYEVLYQFDMEVVCDAEEE